MLNPMSGVLLRVHVKRQRGHKEELHVKTKAEIGAMQLQPKEGLQDCWESPETRARKAPFLGSSEGASWASMNQNCE